MSKILYAEGVNGTIAILNGGTNLENTIANPLANLSNIHFHSGLDYLRLANYFNVNISFPSRQANTASDTSKGKTYTWYVPTYGVSTYSLGYHNLGYKPVCLLYQNTDGLAGNFPIQQDGLSLRLASLGINNDQVYIVENWVTYQNSLASTVQNFKVLVFKDP